MQLTLETVNDFMKDTEPDLGEPDFTDISSNLQKHVAMDELLTDGHQEIFDSGSSIQFNVLVAQSNQARHVSLAEPDNVGMRDGMIQGTAYWRMSETKWMTIHQLVSMNAGKRQIVNWMKQQRLMALISLAELMERTFWSPPSATDQKTPWGLPYYVTKNGTNGFTGGVLAGYSTCLGIDPAMWPGWQNYAVPYDTLTRDNFTRKVRVAAMETEFTPTVPGIPTFATGEKKGYYTNLAVYQALEEQLENQNDNLGADIDPMHNRVNFHGVPVTYVPFLNADTTNPFYAIDWAVAKIAVARGEWMRQTDIPHVANSHNVAASFIDLMWNLLFRNRRTSFVAAMGTTYPG